MNKTINLNEQNPYIKELDHWYEVETFSLSCADVQTNEKAKLHIKYLEELMYLWNVSYLSSKELCLLKGNKE